MAAITFLAEKLLKEAKLNLLKENEQKEDEKNIFLISFYENYQQSDKYLGNWGFKSLDGKGTKIPLSNINITRYIINKISLLYKKEPERTLYYPDKNMPEIQQKSYTEWASFNPAYDVYMKYAERYKNLLDKVLFRPVVDTYNKCWRFYIETYYKPLFWEMDSLNPVAYLLMVAPNTEQFGRPERWFQFWSKEEFFFVQPETQNIRTWFIDQNGERVDYQGQNPYGIIPFVELRSQLPVTQYNSPGAIDIVSTNQAINVALNNIHVAMQYQSFGIVWKTGRADSGNTQIRISPFIVNEIGEEETMNVLNLNPMLQESAETIQKHVSMLGKAYGVNINFTLEASPVSGVSLIIQNIDLLESREDGIDIAIMQENEIYKVLCVLQDHHKKDLPDKEPKLIKEARVRLNFTDIDFPVNIQDDLAMRDWQIRNNIKTPLDYMDNELDFEEKKKLHQLNKEINGNLSRADKLKMAFQPDGKEVLAAD